MSRKITEVIIVSVCLKPPIYHEVERCVVRFRRRYDHGILLGVEEGEDPVQKMLEAIFPGWVLNIRGWHGSLEDAAVSMMINNSGDNTMLIQPPKGSEEPNMLITVSCPQAYF